MFATNPYIAGNPVGDTPGFIGRQDVLREVYHILRRPQDNTIVLYGQRRVGKTSILQQLATQLPNEGPYHPVYYDLEDKAPWPLGRVLSDLARTIAFRVQGRNASKKMQSLDELGDNPEATFCDIWLPGFLDMLPEEASLVLLFDEFDVLADPKGGQAGSALFPYLRDLLTRDPQHLQFVFVIGRKVDDLESIALSLFKGTPAMRVSMLDRNDTIDLIRLSEQNESLYWSEEAIQRVNELTNGHPFLTQQLCSHVWEQAYDEDPGEPPSASREAVENAVPETLEASSHSMEWIWDGLPPAERVVISALAKAGDGPITQEELERVLQESGVRVVIRELQNAPQLLQEWDLIEPADGGYRFRVELLRQWILEHKPLGRVQEELDRVDPVAENLYQVAYSYYRKKQLDAASERLREAVGLNPNHVGANQLLAEILLSQGEVEEALELLERLYEYQPAAARHRLVQALLQKAQNVKSDDERLSLYNRVLEVDPRRQEALSGLKKVWVNRAKAALRANRPGEALAAYQRISSGAQSAAEAKLRAQIVEAGVQKLNDLENTKEFKNAYDLAQKFADSFPTQRDWQVDLDRLEHKTRLSEDYQRGLGAMQSGDRETATELFLRVVELVPDYEEAALHLLRAITGMDVKEMEAHLSAEQEKRRQAENEIDRLKGDLDNAKKEQQSAGKQIKYLSDELDKAKNTTNNLGRQVKKLQNQLNEQEKIASARTEGSPAVQEHNEAQAPAWNRFTSTIKSYFEDLRRTQTAIEPLFWRRLKFSWRGLAKAIRYFVIAVFIVQLVLIVFSLNSGAPIFWIPQIILSAASGFYLGFSEREEISSVPPAGGNDEPNNPFWLRFASNAWAFIGCLLWGTITLSGFTLLFYKFNQGTDPNLLGAIALVVTILAVFAGIERWSPWKNSARGALRRFLKT